MRRYLQAAVVTALAGFLACQKPLPVPGTALPASPADSAVLRSAVVVLRWTSGDGTADFQVEVATDSRFKQVAVDEVVTSDTCAVILATDGEYWWRVRPRSADSVWGDWTDQWRFTLERYRIVASTRTQGYPHDICIAGGRAYVADGQAGLAVYDISLPESPAFLGAAMDSLNESWGVAVRDSYAFVAYGYTELLVLDVRRPDSMVAVGELSYPQPAYGYDVAVQDSWVYIAADAQFIKVNVADPRYPNLVFQGYYPRDCRGVAVEGRYGYVACEQLGIASWLLDTMPPVQVGNVDSPSNARGVAARGQYVYVADGRDGLVVVDVSDPRQPRQVSALALSGYANAVAVEETLAFVTCGSGGLSIVNVARPDAPSLVSRVSTNYAQGVFPAGAYVYACDRDWGLLVIKHEE
jgi:hypothetical protein